MKYAAFICSNGLTIYTDSRFENIWSATEGKDVRNHWMNIEYNNELVPINLNNVIMIKSYEKEVVEDAASEKD